MFKSSVSVIVPAFNEEASIEAALFRLATVLESHFEVFEIILVSDGSTDETCQVAKGTELRGLKVIEYHPNRGKGFALQTGFRESNGDLVVFFDGDLDIHPNAVPVLVDMLGFQNAQAVVGSKHHPNSNVAYPRIRRIQSVAFSQLVARLFELRVHDTQTGVKVFRRDALQPHLLEVRTTGFAFDLELLARMSADGLRIIEGPVEIDYRFDSRISIIEPLKMIRDMLIIKKQLARSSHQGAD